jgi:hypothetical protein
MPYYKQDGQWEQRIAKCEQDHFEMYRAGYKLLDTSLNEVLKHIEVSYPPE